MGAKWGYFLMFLSRLWWPCWPCNILCDFPYPLKQFCSETIKNDSTCRGNHWSLVFCFIKAFFGGSKPPPYEAALSTRILAPISRKSLAISTVLWYTNHRKAVKSWKKHICFPFCWALRLLVPLARSIGLARRRTFRGIMSPFPFRWSLLWRTSYWCRRRMYALVATWNSRPSPTNFT